MDLLSLPLLTSDRWLQSSKHHVFFLGVEINSPWCIDSWQQCGRFKYESFMCNSRKSFSDFFYKKSKHWRNLSSKTKGNLYNINNLDAKYSHDHNKLLYDTRKASQSDPSINISVLPHQCLHLFDRGINWTHIVMAIWYSCIMSHSVNLINITPFFFPPQFTSVWTFTSPDIMMTPIRPNLHVIPAI